MEFPYSGISKTNRQVLVLCPRCKPSSYQLLNSEYIYLILIRKVYYWSEKLKNRLRFGLVGSRLGLKLGLIIVSQFQYFGTNVIFIP